jgi:hypothetical protein
MMLVFFCVRGVGSYCAKFQIGWAHKVVFHDTLQFVFL